MKQFWIKLKLHWLCAPYTDKMALLINAAVAIMLLSLVTCNGCAQVATSMIQQAGQSYAQSSYWSQEWCVRSGLITENQGCCVSNWNKIHARCGNHNGACVEAQVKEICDADQHDKLQTNLSELHD